MTLWLADKSALTRLGLSIHPTEWAERVQRGLVAVTSMTRLEMGYSARSALDHARILDLPPIRAMPVEYLMPATEDRAVWVQRELAARGQHRAPSVPDLLIAATAELSGRVLLHLDKDFELIADITGQPLERLELL